jgi:hypothetical protein
VGSVFELWLTHRLQEKRTDQTYTTKTSVKKTLRLKRKKRLMRRKRLNKRVTALLSKVGSIEKLMAQSPKRKTAAPPKRRQEFIQAELDLATVPVVSVADEGKAAMAKLIADRNKPVPVFNDLIDLFNVKEVDRVYQTPDGRYVPETKKRKATHKLVPTLWNDPKDVAEMEAAIRPKFLAAKWEPVALSVCAMPLRRKLRKGNLPLKHPLPKSTTKWPEYLVTMSLGMKRITLKEYAAYTGCWRKMRRKIDKLMHKECDAMVKEFAMGSRWLREKIKLDPKNVAYWAERKLAMAKLAEERKVERAKIEKQRAQKKSLFDHFDKETKQVIASALTETVKFNQLRT